jgi:beta-lactamase class A
MAVLTSNLQKAVDQAIQYATLVYAAPAGAISICAKRLDVFDAGEHLQDELFYPASLVKVFYLTYAGVRVMERKLKLTGEMQRAIHDMIQDSSNDATNWVLECLTGASSGPELEEPALRAWMDKRQAINRYFRPLGYNLNACQKTWDWGPYGRERQGYGPRFELRNAASANHVARLFAELALGKHKNGSWALDELRRTVPADNPETGSQARDFIGKCLPTGTKLWSKAGWTDSVRHDAALFDLPNGHRYVLVILTKGLSHRTELIPDVANKVLENLGEL